MLVFVIICSLSLYFDHVCFFLNMIGSKSGASGFVVFDAVDEDGPAYVS